MVKMVKHLKKVRWVLTLPNVEINRFVLSLQTCKFHQKRTRSTEYFNVCYRDKCIKSRGKAFTYVRFAWSLFNLHVFLAGWIYSSFYA